MNPLLQKQLEKSEDQARIKQKLMQDNKDAARAHLLQISLLLSKQAKRI